MNINCLKTTITQNNMHFHTQVKDVKI
jgi:hypothetical protein